MGEEADMVTDGIAPGEDLAELSQPSRVDSTGDLQYGSLLADTEAEQAHEGEAMEPQELPEALVHTESQQAAHGTTEPTAESGLLDSEEVSWYTLAAQSGMLGEDEDEDEDAGEDGMEVDG